MELGSVRHILLKRPRQPPGRDCSAALWCNKVHAARMLCGGAEGVEESCQDHKARQFAARSQAQRFVCVATVSVSATARSANAVPSTTKKMVSGPILACARRAGNPKEWFACLSI